MTGPSWFRPPFERLDGWTSRRCAEERCPRLYRLSEKVLVPKSSTRAFITKSCLKRSQRSLNNRNSIKITKFEPSPKNVGRSQLCTNDEPPRMLKRSSVQCMPSYLLRETKPRVEAHASQGYFTMHVFLHPHTPPTPTPRNVFTNLFENS